jgi:hypothetical protein
MYFNALDSIIFFSKTELNTFLLNYTEEEFNKRIAQNTIFAYMIPWLYNDFYIYKHYHIGSLGVIRIWSNGLYMTEPPYYIGVSIMKYKRTV